MQCCNAYVPYSYVYFLHAFQHGLKVDQWWSATSFAVRSTDCVGVATNHTEPQLVVASLLSASVRVKQLQAQDDFVSMDMQVCQGSR